MPRVIYSPLDGSDVSTATQAILIAGQNFQLANLYTFANRVFWTADATGNIALWTYTDADLPVAVNYLQLFASGSLSLTGLNSGNVLCAPAPGISGVNFLPRGGSNDGGFKHSALTYEVGLTAQNVDVTWLVDDNADYFAQFGAYPTLINPPVAILPMKQAMAYYRAFDECPFWIHRAIFSNGGLIGTTLMFRGFIRKTEAATDYLKISLGSLMQIVQDTPVPGQTIQPNGRTAPFLPFPTVSASLAPPVTRISAKTYTFGGSVFAANALQDCWVTFNPAVASLNFAPQSGLPPVATPVWRIQSNTGATSSGSGTAIISGSSNGGPIPWVSAVPYNYGLFSGSAVYPCFGTFTNAYAFGPQSIPMSAGESVTLEYLGGQITYFACTPGLVKSYLTPSGFGPGSTAGGVFPWPSDRCSARSDTLPPLISGGYPTGSQGSLLGAYADSGGVLTTGPFNLAQLAGGSITLPPAPAGTTQLLLGINNYEQWWPFQDGEWTIGYSITTAGSSAEVTFYDPPVIPGTVNNVNLFSPISETGGAPGFPSVPPPENAL